uniref:NADH-ubiquinone oxidoreductase chain 3 n=1 Tax=Leptotrombidium akamushi TaxID=299468 RepID=Q3C2I1_9ACAR|nr:NADH dehydrogenase subunit 3 [Leptotrombidium akamushi]BAE47116.1 NADH dehydrogenase subunit 3 [Leptotrombidium akamushi]
MILFLCFIFFSLIWFFSNKEESYGKNSSFESGFDSKNLSISFSNQYYLVAVLFLIFDLEIVLTFPIPLSMSKSGFLGSLFFLFFSVVLLFEWKFGLLDWIK